MTSGDLSDRLTIQTPTTTADAQGGRATTWATLTTVWGHVKPAGQAEMLGLREFIVAIGGYEITIRMREDVTVVMRLLWTPRWPSGCAEKTLQIHGVQPTQDRAWLVLRCAEVN